MRIRSQKAKFNQNLFNNYLPLNNTLQAQSLNIICPFTRKLLRKALLQLPTKQRMAVIRCIILGQTHKQIAVIYNLTVTRVQQLYVQGIAAMRKILNQHYFNLILA